MTGKDIIIFVTPEDHKTPSTVTLPDDVESEPGILHLVCVCIRGVVNQELADTCARGGDRL